MSAIYLIRHGKTEANEKHLYCGITDLPLSEAGAQALRELSYPDIRGRFVCSGLRRTEQTLKILFGEVPFSVEPELQEVNFGTFEMHSYEELKNDPAYQRWLEGDNEKNVPPGGESGMQMQARVRRAFARICAESGSTVIVTHGGVIAAIMADMFPQEGRNRYQWQPEPGHGYVLENGAYREIP